jgi:hypothetical protein
MSTQEANEGNAAKCENGQSAPTGRLPYRRPTLVEYGSVAKLTEGSHGSRADNSILGMPCL